ncbi:MAG: glycosyltransferase family 2 protein [Acidobacteriota bacterium]
MAATNEASVDAARFVLRAPGCEQAAYVPCESQWDGPSLLAGTLVHESDVITPILPVVRESTVPHAARSLGACGWIAPTDAALLLFNAAAQPSEWGLTRLLALVESQSRWWRFNSSPIRIEDDPPRSEQSPILTAKSRVLAVVSHFACEQWLAQCLHSLTNQTRPPENILVVDDSSAEPPIEIVRAFPEVTLLATPVNIGPENILQNVIRTLDYDAFLVQDSDDWSSANRLHALLHEAERTAAAVVGTQELRLPDGWREVLLRMHPLDANRAIAGRIGHYVCHGTSLISRAAAKSVGGFDTNLQLTADTDFILRLSHFSRIVNLPAAHYYRRMRPGSRTTSAQTGQGSPLRDQERELIFDRARRLFQSTGPEAASKFMPVAQTTPIQFRHILGPKLPMDPW